MAPTDSGTWFITLEQNADAPRLARHALEVWFPDVPDQVRENAVIAVGELVANAVRFGAPPIRARADLGADELVVEVCDEGEDRPHRRVPAQDGGIGLNVVYLLADWVDIEADRSCVRCGFGTTAAPSSSWPTVAPADRNLHSIEVVRQARTLRVGLRGDIDVAARPDLDRLSAELDPAQLDRVVIDLREVTFFDSTGLHMAQRFDRWGRDHDVAVMFTRGIPAVMLALQAAGLAHRVRFSNAPEDRLA